MKLHIQAANRTTKPMILATLLAGALLPAIGAQAAPEQAAPETDAPKTGNSTVITQAQAPTTPTTFNQGMLFPYSIFDRALADKVDKTGNVDYATLRGDANLALFLQALATADVSQFPVLPKKDEETGIVTQSRNPELVFWINAYNAHVMKTVSDAYPIDNIDNIKNFDSAKAHLIAGKNWSFAELRQKIISFDPRGVFAITNGTKGGPLMSAQSYRFRTINNDLNDAVMRFINDQRNVSLLRIQNKVTLSDYFKIVNDAFSDKNNARKMAGLRKVLTTFATQKGGAGYLGTSEYRIDFTPSDKRVNVQTK